MKLERKTANTSSPSPIISLHESSDRPVTEASRSVHSNDDFDSPGNKLLNSQNHPKQKKIGQIVSVKCDGGMITGRILSRGGKKGGKHENWRNMKVITPNSQCSEGQKVYCVATAASPALFLTRRI